MWHQVIEENASFNLLSSQDVQGHTSVREHQNISPLKMVTLTMLNKYWQMAKIKG
jgi:hypothetical protein